jgi:hypothetical protein
MSRTSRLVELSAYLYRLLLAAYPAAFRNEYGEAMVQLFHDTARDAYRRRGFLGLTAMWLRTLVDFTISAIRQHRDKPVEVSSESVLLRDFLQNWRRLGSDVLSVTTYSTWYGLHLLRLNFQRATRTWARLTALSFGLWFVTCLHSFTVLRGQETSVYIRRGLVQIEHRYEVEEAMSFEEFCDDFIAWRKRNPSLTERLYAPIRPWEFGFLSDIYGESFLHPSRTKPGLIEPCKSWRLRFPFGILPVLLLVWTIRVYLRRKGSSVAVGQSA